MSDCNHFWRAINSRSSQCSKCGEITRAPCRDIECASLRARVAELEAEHDQLVKSINRAGGLTSQGASHELIRQILREALEGKREPAE